MRSLVTTLARMALLPLVMMTATTLAESLAVQPLWQYQWVLENNDDSRGVCTSVPMLGECERDSALPVIDMDINGLTTLAGAQASPRISTGFQPSTTYESTPVVIGLIDTGIDYHHPDLVRHIWTNPGEISGTDADNNGVDDGCEDSLDGDGNGYLNDCHGINTLVPATLSGGTLNPAAGDPLDSTLAHGTHMAGLMVGDTGNGMGIQGVAGNANVQVVTCKSAQMEAVLALVPGTALPALTQDRMQQCVNYFIALKQRGVNLTVINASGGMSAFVNLGLMWAKVKPRYLLDPAIFLPMLAQLRALDVLVVGAAGNMSWDMDAREQERAYFPGAFAADNVLSVAAIDAQGKLWHGSSHGRYTVDVAAPGHHVLSTLPSTGADQGTASTGQPHYGIASGTSPATALVSGLAALIKASPQTAHLSAADVRRLIMSSGRILPALQDKTVSARSIRVSDANGQGALTCAHQILQRRLLPKTGELTLLPGATLHLEIESFNCADISPGPVLVTSAQGVTLALQDNGEGADRLAGDGIFSADWVIPDAPADNYQFVIDQGTGLPTETLTVRTSIIADNGDVASEATGSWWPSTLREGYWGAGYNIAYTSNTERLFQWHPMLPRSGRYEVLVRWPKGAVFASNALFRFTDGDGVTESMLLNQKDNGGRWVSAGEFRFDAGNAQFTLSNAGADGTVAADAIKLVWKSY